MTAPVLMPQMGESIAECTIVRWLKNVGERIERDEPLFEISTDKVDAEIPSPASGVLSAITVQAGETAAVNSVIAMIGDTAEAAAPSSPPPAKAAAPQSAAPAAAAVSAAPRATETLTAEEARRAKSSPVVRRLAKENGLDIAQIAGTGLGGRVTRQDILQRISAGPASARTAAAADRVEPMSVMRKKIAEHMVLSRRTSAHVHSVFQVNFSAIEKIRDLKKAECERDGVKLTYMAFVARAVLDAIARHPVMNASIDGTSVVYKKDVNLGIAVALENGLIVPVVRCAQDKSIRGLARAIADVALRARTRKLSPEEVLEGTFTITNPGQFGAQFGLPIINQPQVAILGMGTIEKRPIVIEDAIAIRTMSYLTLGFDHRLIDGAVADEFMADIKRRIETFDAKEV